MKFICLFIFFLLTDNPVFSDYRERSTCDRILNVKELKDLFQKDAIVIERQLGPMVVYSISDPIPHLGWKITKAPIRRGLSFPPLESYVSSHYLQPSEQNLSRFVIFNPENPSSAALDMIRERAEKYFTPESVIAAFIIEELESRINPPKSAVVVQTTYAPLRKIYAEIVSDLNLSDNQMSLSDLIDRWKNLAYLSGLNTLTEAQKNSFQAMMNFSREVLKRTGENLLIAGLLHTQSNFYTSAQNTFFWPLYRKYANFYTDLLTNTQKRRTTQKTEGKTRKSQGKEIFHETRTNADLLANFPMDIEAYWRSKLWAEAQQHIPPDSNEFSDAFKVNRTLSWSDAFTYKPYHEGNLYPIAPRLNEWMRELGSIQVKRHIRMSIAPGERILVEIPEVMPFVQREEIRRLLMNEGAIAVSFKVSENEMILIEK